MHFKSEAHKTLLLLHNRDGVSNLMIMDGSKEQTLGEFCWKNCEVGTHMCVHWNQTQPSLTPPRELFVSSRKGQDKT